VLNRNRLQSRNVSWLFAGHKSISRNYSSNDKSKRRPVLVGRSHLDFFSLRPAAIPRCTMHWRANNIGQPRKYFRPFCKQQKVFQLLGDCISSLLKYFLPFALDTPEESFYSKPWPRFIFIVFLCDDYEKRFFTILAFTSLRSSQLGVEKSDIALGLRDLRVFLFAGTWKLIKNGRHANYSTKIGFNFKSQFRLTYSCFLQI